jgi:hypothetical protein
VDANLITGLAGVLGSVSGASAAIATTWIAQKSQTVRERAKSETRKREILYGEFITEAARLLADAFDHSLDRPETLVNLTQILAGSAFFHRMPCTMPLKNAVTAFSTFTPDRTRTADQLIATIRSGDLGFFRKFSDACRLELRNYTAY